MQERPHPRQAKRADIQGLRALAVSLVVIEHVSGVPRGGFVGVDVFFVLSGFLITGLLLGEQARTGRISLGRFYIRRVKRLMPAAAIVLLTSLGAVLLFLPMQRFVSAAVDAGWSAVFLANWHFAAQETDYFASGGPVSPFQHFWSLSVEEQFYLVIPLLLVVLLAIGTARTGRRLALVAVMTIALASLAWGLVASAAEPSTAYFSTAARAWELGVGAVLAFLPGVWQRIPPRAGSALSWIGLLGIVASGLLITDGLPFPAPFALAPVLSTALVLIGGANPRNPGLVVLRNRPVVALGDVSYSLYLWHFPVYVVIASVAPAAAWVTYPLSLALAVVSFHAIEQPFMHVPWPGIRGSGARHRWRTWAATNRTAMLRSGVGTIAIAAVIITLASVDRLKPIEVPVVSLDQTTEAGSPDADGASDTQAGPAVQALQTEIATALMATSWPELDQDPGGPMSGGSHLPCSDTKAQKPVAECTFGPSDAPHTMMLVGDSTAAHELDALVAMVEQPGSQWNLVARAGFACSFIDVDVRGDALETCKAYKAETFDLIASIHPQVLVVTNSFAALPLAGTERDMTTAEWSAGLKRYLDRATPLVGSVVQIAPPPAGKSIEECYRPGSMPQACVTSVSAEWMQRLAAAGRASDGVVVDTRPLFCLDGKCPAFIGKDVVKQDFVHLTGAYAVAMSPGLQELLVSADAVPGGFPTSAEQPETDRQATDQPGDAVPNA